MRGLFLLLVAASLPTNVAQIATPCDGTREIPRSTWVIKCGAASVPCGDDWWHLFGVWKGCCCKNNSAYDTKDSYLMQCLPCEGGAPPLLEEEEDEGHWPPRSLRDFCRLLRTYLGFLVMFNAVPWLMRSSVHWFVHDLIAALSMQYLGCNVCRLQRDLMYGEREPHTAKPRLVPGALILLDLEHGGREVRRVKTEKEEGHDRLREALVNHRAKILPADITWMSYEEYAGALSLSPHNRRISFILHFLCWHLQQIVLFLITIVSFLDVLEGMQRVYAALAVVKELLYAWSLATAYRKRPACMLYNPLAACRNGAGLWEIVSYVVGPEKWLSRMAYVKETNKPTEFYIQVYGAFILDIVLCLGLIDNLYRQQSPLQLNLCYAYSAACVVCLGLTWLCSDFYSAVKDADGGWYVDEWRIAHEPLDSLSSAYTFERLHQAKRFTAAQFRDARFELHEMKGGFDVTDLRRAGFETREFWQAGFTASELRNAGFKLREFIDAGYELRDLRDLGFEKQDWDVVQVEPAGLRRAGFTVSELRRAGFELRKIMDAGYELRDFRGVGFMKWDWDVVQVEPEGLLQAGFTASDLRDADFVPRDLWACRASDLRKAGFTVYDLMSAHFEVSELAHAGFGVRELKETGLELSALRSVGFVKQDWDDAQVTPSDLSKAGFTAADLKNAGFKASELKSAGFALAELLNADFSLSELKGTSFKKPDWQKAGVTASALGEAGFNAQDMQRAGFTKSDVVNAGFSESDFRGL